MVSSLYMALPEFTPSKTACCQFAVLSAVTVRFVNKHEALAERLVRMDRLGSPDVVQVTAMSDRREQF